MSFTHYIHLSVYNSITVSSSLSYYITVFIYQCAICLYLQCSLFIYAVLSSSINLNVFICLSTPQCSFIYNIMLIYHTISICLYHSMFICLSVYITVFIYHRGSSSVYHIVFIHQSVSICLYHSVHPSKCVCLSISQSSSIIGSSSVYHSIHPSKCVSLYHRVHLS